MIDEYSYRSITLSVAEFVDGASVVPMLDAKPLFRLALPDIELGRYVWLIDGVPGMKDEGVNSPLSKFPPPVPGRPSRIRELSK